VAGDRARQFAAAGYGIVPAAFARVQAAVESRVPALRKLHHVFKLEVYHVGYPAGLPGRPAVTCVGKGHRLVLVESLWQRSAVAPVRASPRNGRAHPIPQAETAR
jgi:hypothetical protein